MHAFGSVGASGGDSYLLSAPCGHLSAHTLAFLSVN
jgi:hypothetical protein